ncbi:MAG: class I SAM-dependent methyltransferase [Magnetospirillum sp.]|nr:class I SAM-dependent methyltransferase [Magnetospirillum sp.]
MAATVTLGNYSYTCRPRWGFGNPPHAALAEIVGANRQAYAGTLDRFAALAPKLAAIPHDAPDDSPLPRWMNPWFTGFDAVALYGFLAGINPRLLIEVGSGNSTRFARRAIRDNDLRTKVVSVDPQPRAEIDALCDEVIRAPAENVGAGLFAKLKAGDVLFIDSSHRSFENSDVTALFLEVLPALEPGVVVHVHDVYLPYDYPPPAEGLLYNEQYLLAALMLGGGRWLEPIFPAYFVSQDAPLSARSAPIWQAIGANAFPAPSNSFWMKVKKRR